MVRDVDQVRERPVERPAPTARHFVEQTLQHLAGRRVSWDRLSIWFLQWCQREHLFCKEADLRQAVKELGCEERLLLTFEEAATGNEQPPEVKP